MSKRPKSRTEWADKIGSALISPNFVPNVRKRASFRLRKMPRKVLQFEKLEPQVPGSSTVEHSAVNRRVASSNLARGANLSSLFFNDLEKVRLRENCTEMVQLSEFCPSSHSRGHFAAALLRAGNAVTFCFGAARK